MPSRKVEAKLMRTPSLSKHAVWWSSCALLLACANDVATTSIGLSGESSGAVTDDSLDTGDVTEGSITAEGTVGETGNDEMGDTTTDDPSVGTDDGGVG